MTIPDLGALKHQQELEQAAQEAQDAERRAREFEAWDKAMTRAFKGIMPRPTRHMFLRLSLQRQLKEAEDA